MRKTFFGSVLLVSAVGGSACLETGTIESTSEQFAQLSGAIFTTTATGARVNANIYDLKTDVYLDGGPGPGAPASAACLPAGAYYFMVTDPPGKELLSTSALGCRRFLVTAACTIAYAPESCATPHLTGTDVDHGGATIQLMPYNDTPNNGGEYKVWATPVGKFVQGGANFGFTNSDSKTDNYKVRESEEPPHPCCGDGHWDPGEACDDSNLDDGDGCSSLCEIEYEHEPRCGDGYVDPGEACDDGNAIDTDACTNACELCPPSDGTDT